MTPNYRVEALELEDQKGGQTVGKRKTTLIHCEQHCPT
jgi:hypothetical protein